MLQPIDGHYFTSAYFIITTIGIVIACAIGFWRYREDDQDEKGRYQPWMD